MDDFRIVKLPQHILPYSREKEKKEREREGKAEGKEKGRLLKSQKERRKVNCHHAIWINDDHPCKGYCPLSLSHHFLIHPSIHSFIYFFFQFRE